MLRAQLARAEGRLADADGPQSGPLRDSADSDRPGRAEEILAEAEREARAIVRAAESCRTVERQRYLAFVEDLTHLLTSSALAHADGGARAALVDARDDLVTRLHDIGRAFGNEGHPLAAEAPPDTGIGGRRSQLDRIAVPLDTSEPPTRHTGTSHPMAPPAPAADTDAAPSAAAMGPSPGRQRPKGASRWLRNAGLFVALLCVYELWGTSIRESRAQAALHHSLTTADASGTSGVAPVGPAASEGSAVARMVIPRVGLSTIVVEGTTHRDLSRGPGHVSFSALPGAPGNVVVAGHRSIYGSPLRRLSALRAGDEVVLTTSARVVHYTVTGGARQTSSDDPSLAAQAGDQRLTLVTAAGWWGSRRLVVTATQRGPLSPAPPPVVPGSRPTTVALGGDGSAWLALATWSMLVVVLWVEACDAPPPWRRAAMIGSSILTPLVLVALFESLNRFSPAVL
ncbi:MAG: sortase [Actinobacteria bacterium]|nr:sortase [Actinomycetota bacterium]